MMLIDIVIRGFATPIGAASLTSKCVGPIFVNEDLVVIRWNFTLEIHDGRLVEMDELTYQRWEGERIAEETMGAHWTAPARSPAH